MRPPSGSHRGLRGSFRDSRGGGDRGERGLGGFRDEGPPSEVMETFDVDISITKKLLEGERGQVIHRKSIIVVGVSGLFTPKDIAMCKMLGLVQQVLLAMLLLNSSTRRYLTSMPLYICKTKCRSERSMRYLCPSTSRTSELR